MPKYLDGGITRTGEGYGGAEWTILGQRYVSKATCASTFAFETMSAPGQFVPVHIHPHQDQFILVQEGELELKLDGEWQTARAGDLVRMPRGVPHGHFNKSGAPCRALFWVSPAGRLRELFETLHGMTDIPAIVQVSKTHDIDFLPPEADE